MCAFNEKAQNGIDGGAMGRVCEKHPQKNAEFSTYQIDSIAMGLKCNFTAVLD